MNPDDIRKQDYYINYIAKIFNVKPIVVSTVIESGFKPKFSVFDFCSSEKEERTCISFVKIKKGYLYHTREDLEVDVTSEVVAIMRSMDALIKE